MIKEREKGKKGKREKGEKGKAVLKRGAKF